MRVMILAAGRGERLRPLTDTVPKAMVEAGGKPLIAWHLERLAAAGYGEAVINVSHLADHIVEGLGNGERYGVRITYSREREPLETAGGIAKARALLGEAPFLLVNADIYCEFDFSGLRRVSLGARLAHLVLVANPPHRSGGDFTLEDGTVGDGAAPRYTYSGIAVMSPAMVAGVAPGQKAPLAPLLYAAAARRLVGGELYHGVWQDVGTRARLAELEAHLASGSPRR
jgi:N-acetyl-alpha-D-muramate 1-phosphate uridylyltransferase